MFAEMTLAELNALAERQRRQIEEQEKSMHTKQQRLSFLTQQSQQNGKNIYIVNIYRGLSTSAQKWVSISPSIRFQKRVTRLWFKNDVFLNTG